MNRDDFVFLCELLMSREEKGLFLSLIANPHDQATRNAYIDYLKEQDRSKSVDLLEGRTGYVPGWGYTSPSISSGAIASGWIGTAVIASGSIISGYGRRGLSSGAW